MDQNNSGKVNHYFPLRIHSRFPHNTYGFVPSKKHKKWKRWFLFNGPTQTTFNNNFCNILFQMYVNMRQLYNSDIATQLGTHLDLKRSFRKIIPEEYYGSNYNRQKLFFIIERIITQNQGEYIHISAFYKNFRYEEIPWLSGEDNFMDQVLQANILVIQTVIKPVIRSYYYFMASFKDNGFSVVPRGLADEFFTKSQRKLCKLRHVFLVDSAESTAPKPIGRLTLYPKFGITEIEYRPIVHINRIQSAKKGRKAPISITEISEDIDGIPVDIKAIKYKLKCMVKKQKTIGGSSKFYDKWIKFFEKSENKKRLYAIKLDLLDAFGLIDINKLEDLIIRPSEEGFLLNHEVKYLLDLLSNQHVTIREKKRVYKWDHGLLQGLHLSPLLCELYLTHATKECFRGFDMTNCFFHRAVDDIFFISTNEDKINEFELLIFKTQILNQSKTQRYLDEKLDDPEIVFCGKLFNLETRETCTLHNYKKRQDLSSKFKLWNRKKQFSDDGAMGFLKNAMKYAPLNHFFSKFDLNTVSNTVDTVIKNIFHGMCYVAIKLICAVETIQYLFANQENCCQVVIKIMRYIQRRYSVYIDKTIQMCKGKHYKPLLSVLLLKLLCYKAFYVVFQKKNCNYKAVLKHLKVQTKGYFIEGLSCNTDVKYISTLPKVFRNVKCGRNTLLY